jgi:predicted dehydrogenase
LGGRFLINNFAPVRPVSATIAEQTGKAAGIHTARLRGMDGVERFYASRDAARAEALNRRAGGRGAFGSYAAAIEDPRVHAVVIGTPPTLHRELALAALAAGKHVVVEKPPFYSTEDFDAVAAAFRFVDGGAVVDHLGTEELRAHLEHHWRTTAGAH